MGAGSSSGGTLGRISAKNVACTLLLSVPFNIVMGPNVRGAFSGFSAGSVFYALLSGVWAGVLLLLAA